MVKNSTGSPIALRGKTLTDLEIWRLARALDGTEVEVECGPPARPEIKYVMTGVSKNGVYSSCSSHLIQNDSDRTERWLQLHNHGYYLTDRYRGQGHAWAAVALQVATAHRLGFGSIRVLANGHVPAHVTAAEAAGPALLTHRVGIIQWSKVGFDAPLPRDFFDRHPTHQLRKLGITSGDTLSKLMLTEEGRDLWKAFAITLSMTLTMPLYPASGGALKLLACAASRPLSLRIDGS